ncbi:MAG TPA: molecular chaperone DnaJ, partial [Alphaproteobacteria bacterium]|nr:molecular chaperone DnaJ [Alphaproteobacteria bacterium]
MHDPYSVLGVPRGASDDEIKQAFRAGAKRWHPDTPEGASDRGRRFKVLTSAYEILGDPVKRGQYDRGEIDGNGDARPRKADGPRTRADAWDQVAPQPHANGSTNGHAGPASTGSINSASKAIRWAFEKAFGLHSNPDNRRRRRVDDLFAEFFADERRDSKPSSTRKGLDLLYDLSITFEEAVLGGLRRVKMPNGKRFDVKVPAGVREGQVIRLKGLGEQGLLDGPNGDALVTISIEPHPFYRREGRDVRLDLPVTLLEALSGARIKVPTLYGPVTMTIPENANSGDVYRLKGKGVPAQGVQEAGDQLVSLVVRLPDKLNPALAEAVRRWEQIGRA